MKNVFKKFFEWYIKTSHTLIDLISKNNKKGEKKMTHEFYDVKAKQKVTTNITAKTTYGEGKRVRYAVKGLTEDGRNLTAFVSKAVYDKVK